MIRALYTAASGMNAQQLNIDVISNNLANINTTGYKKSRAEFQDLVYQYLMEPGAPTSQNTMSPSGIAVGLGVKPVGTQKMLSQGDLTSTSNPLDVAIQGEGFFQVQLPDGTVGYTRSGNFQLDSTGALVTQDGYAVVGAQPIPSDATNINISADGQITYKQAGQAAVSSAGTLQGVRFANPAGLKATGNNSYIETQSSGTPLQAAFAGTGMGKLQQGFLESSNVSVVQEVVNMITAQRGYEASSKGISAAEEMISMALNLKR